MANNLYKGTVKWYNIDHNYGFIKLKDGSDVFFHGSQIMNKDHVLDTGDKVEFELHPSKKGKQKLQAKYVDYISDESEKA